MSYGYSLIYILTTCDTTYNLLDVTHTHTVIRFVPVNAKLGTYTVVSVKGTLVEAKMWTFTLEYSHLSSTSVPFTLTTVQLPNLAPS
jgi:hypothetical protein